jgi:hypothetical protein
MVNPRQNHTQFSVSRQGWSGLLVLGVLLVLCGILVGTSLPGTAAAPTSQCVACHTDAAKLKALTPPDPPSEEEGEG